MVEGNTDVIALRQAGFEPVVASMGTALTERQLRELGRLTRKIYLCFDADAAGQEATLRGMELAATQGFEVKVVTLPKGQDPADAPDGFEERLAGAESYLLYRVRLELDRAADRQEGFVRVQGGHGEGRGLSRAAGGSPAPRRPARSSPGDPRRPGARARRRDGGRRQHEAVRCRRPSGARRARGVPGPSVAHTWAGRAHTGPFRLRGHATVSSRARRRAGRPGADRAREPSSTPEPRARRSTSEPARSSSCACASGS